MREVERTYHLRVASASNDQVETVPFEVVNSIAFQDPTLTVYARVLAGLRRL